MLVGEKQRLRMLYEKIVCDKRHHTKIILDEGEIPSRMFGEWAMGSKNVDGSLLTKLPGYARVGETSFDAKEFSNSNDRALDLLRFFHDAP